MPAFLADAMSDDKDPKIPTEGSRPEFVFRIPTVRIPTGVCFWQVARHVDGAEFRKDPDRGLFLVTATQTPCRQARGAVAAPRGTFRPAEW